MQIFLFCVIGLCKRSKSFSHQSSETSNKQNKDTGPYFKYKLVVFKERNCSSTSLNLQ